MVTTHDSRESKIKLGNRKTDDINKTETEIETDGLGLSCLKTEILGSVSVLGYVKTEKN